MISEEILIRVDTELTDEEMDAVSGAISNFYASFKVNVQPSGYTPISRYTPIGRSIGNKK